MKEDSPIQEEQLKLMNELQKLAEEKFGHIFDSLFAEKEDNVITMKIVCKETPSDETEDESCTSPLVDDIDLSLLSFTRDCYHEECLDYLSKNLFRESMPVTLGVHLIRCASTEDKAKNADLDNYLPNGRCLSLMLCAMSDMDMLVFHTRGDMTTILSLIFGTWIMEDKHLLDYFYSRKNTKRVLDKIDYYKRSITLWMDALK